MEILLEVFEIFSDCTFCGAMGDDAAFQACGALPRFSSFQSPPIMVYYSFMEQTTYKRETK